MSYETLRRDKLIAQLSGFSASDHLNIICTDSHGERLELVYGQGAVINSKKYFFCGIAGATWASIRDYMPWSSIAAVQPDSITLMGGINNAVTGQGFDAYGYATDGTLVSAMCSATQNALNIVANPILASSPAPDSAANVPALRVHNAARVLYYVANNIVGSLGRTFTFVDIYSLTANNTCTPASSGYNIPCYESDLMDDIHLSRSGYQTLMTHL